MTIHQLEQQVDAAALAGDWDTAEAAQVELDKALAAKKPATLLASALWYAERGQPVFPCQVGGKAPATAHACYDGTTDLDQIRAWWTKTPDANIGLATGHLVDVVDIDGAAGQASRIKLWDDVFAKIDADNVGKVLTPRPGGLHIYVPATGDSIGTGIAPAIDYRGKGGYVIAPPSRTSVGTYRWLGTPNLRKEDK